MTGVPAVVGGDRLLRRFFRLADEARSRGLSRRVLEDDRFDDESLITLDGARLANFTSCGYLGLNTDERLVEGAIDAVRRYGTAYSSSAAYSALPMYGELRELLASMMGMPVTLAPTTTLMHLAALPVLIRSGDIAVIDAYTHASVQSALTHVRAAGVEVVTVPHRDPAALTEAVHRAAESVPGRVWYLPDGVFSMHGDLAPFATISALLDEVPQLHVYVDDAHGFSWQGSNGSGVAVDALGVRDRVVVAAGLSKSFAATGGVLASADPGLVDLVELCGAPLSFGGPIPPAALGAGLASARIHLSDEHGSLRRALAERIAWVDHLASQAGITFASRDVSPIRYVEVRSVGTMFRIVEGMKEQGFYVNGAMFPIVPQGHAGIRFTITLDVSDVQVEGMIDRLRALLAAEMGESVVVDLRDLDEM